MDRVKSQAAVVSQLLFDPKTADAYKNVLSLTGKIIKEVALLAWLLICSVFVFGAWFSDTAISAGRSARNWWQTQQGGTQDGNQAAAATGKALLDVSQNGANFLLDKAREQLGLEKIEHAAKAPQAVKRPPANPVVSSVKAAPAKEPQEAKPVAAAKATPAKETKPESEETTKTASDA
ncbi:MAG: hypothetical protein ACFB2W_10590 [Leptolyngbyaceae cyanobacterium]